MSPIKTKIKRRKGPPVNIAYTSSTIYTTKKKTVFDFINCSKCGDLELSGNYDADRMMARRHAEDNKHKVTATLSHEIVWDGRKVANRRA